MPNAARVAELEAQLGEARDEIERRATENARLYDGIS